MVARGWQEVDWALTRDDWAESKRRRHLREQTRLAEARRRREAEAAARSTSPT